MPYHRLGKVIPRVTRARILYCNFLKATRDSAEPQGVHEEPEGDTGTESALHISESNEADDKQFGDAGGDSEFVFGVGPQNKTQSTRSHTKGSCDTHSFEVDRTPEGRTEQFDISGEACGAMQFDISDQCCVGSVLVEDGEQNGIFEK